MSENNAVFSIIVPAYKCGDSLEKCANSILNQSFSDFELIIVEDCSPDDGFTRSVCEKLARRDARVKVIYHEKNKGVSAARNDGIAVCRGSYICFIDSDDYIDRDLLKDALPLIRKSDLVSIPYIWDWSEYPDRTNTFVTDFPLWEECETHDEMLKKNFRHIMGVSAQNVNNWIENDSSDVNEGRAPGMSWQFVYRGEIIRKNNLRFCQDLYFKEDEIFIIDYLCYANSLSKLKKGYYYYYQRKTSLVHTLSKNQEKKLANKIALLREKNRLRKKILEKDHIDVLPMYEGSNVLSAVEMSFMCSTNGMAYGKYKRYIADCELQKCIKHVRFRFKRLKVSVPILMLKCHAYLLLFLCAALLAACGFNPYKSELLKKGQNN